MAFPFGWKHKLKISIDHLSIGSDLTDWTFVFDQSFDSILTKSSSLLDISGSHPAKFDGGDLRFSYDVAGNIELPIDIRKFTSSAILDNRKLEIAAKIPLVSSINDTTFYMWWGNENASKPSSSEAYGQFNAYDDNYKVVYNLDNNPNDNNIEDRTSNAYHGMPEGGLTGSNLVIGKIGNAISFSSSNDDVIVGPSSNDLTGDNNTTLTMEVLVKSITDSTNEYILSLKRLSTNSTLFTLNANQGSIGQFGLLTARPVSGHSYMNYNGGYNDGNWHYLAGVINNSDRILVVDGEQVISDTDGIQSVTGNTAPFTVGGFADGYANLYSDAVLDEVRVSDIARSDDWLDANYKNQFNSGSFNTFGNIETQMSNSYDLLLNVKKSYEYDYDLLLDVEKVSSSFINYDLSLNVHKIPVIQAVTNEKRKKPLPRSRRKLYNGSYKFDGIPSKTNRAEHLKRTDVFQNVSIELEDIDISINYHLKNTVIPKVQENGLEIPVHIMYGSPERWKASKKDGFIRDKKGKIILPALMFSRTSLARDDSVPVDKLDRNLLYSFKKSWSSKNKYDMFSILNDQRPREQFYNVAIPDYVIINYECVVWTSYISQMNKVIQQLLYSESSFWGDPLNFVFNVRIDSFDQTSELSTEEERAIKTNFTMQVKAYLIPEEYNELITTQKSLSPVKISFDVETDIDPSSIDKYGNFPQQIPKNLKGKPPFPRSPGQGIESTVTRRKIPVPYQGIVTEFGAVSVQATATQAASNSDGLNYLLKEKQIKADLIIENNGLGQSVAVFSNEAIASAPVGFPVTDKFDFHFWVNGDHVEYDAITALLQVGDQVRVLFEIGNLGYSLETGDEIFAWGPFEVGEF